MNGNNLSECKFGSEFGPRQSRNWNLEPKSWWIWSEKPTTWNEGWVWIKFDINFAIVKLIKTIIFQNANLEANLANAKQYIEAKKHQLDESGRKNQELELKV